MTNASDIKDGKMWRDFKGPITVSKADHDAKNINVNFKKKTINGIKAPAGAWFVWDTGGRVF